MKRHAVLLVLLLTQTGCLAPFNRRLDQYNAHLEKIHFQMERANVRLVEAINELKRMEEHLERTNQKLETMERFMKRFGRIDADEDAGPRSEVRSQLTDF